MNPVNPNEFELLIQMIPKNSVSFGLIFNGPPIDSNSIGRKLFGSGINSGMIRKISEFKDNMSNLILTLFWLAMTGDDTGDSPVAHNNSNDKNKISKVNKTLFNQD